MNDITSEQVKLIKSFEKTNAAILTKTQIAAI
jgi:hypothetical protein